MAISETLLQYKYQAVGVVAVLFATVAVVVYVVAPSFLQILNYFSPLLVSTAVFFIAVVVINRSYSKSSDEASTSSGEGYSAIDDKGYFGHFVGEKGILESLVAEQHEGGTSKMVLDSLLNEGKGF